MKHLMITLLAACGMSLSAAAATDTPAQTPAQTDSLSRAAATVMAQAVSGSLDNIEHMGVKIDRELFAATLGAALKGGDTSFTAESANAYIDSYINSLRPNRPDTVDMASQTAFLAKAAAESGAQTLPSGLIFTIITEGEGVSPKATDLVDVNYIGRLSDGEIFDQTQETPATFNVDGVIPGFSEGLQLMKPGGTYRLTIPANLAYGPKGIPGIIPGNSALEFTVTLEGVKAPAPGDGHVH